MQTEPQNSAELAPLRQLLATTSVAMLTSPDAHGALVSQPMLVLEMDGAGALWFFTDLRSEKVEHLRAVNLAFADGARARYVSVSGHGEIHADPAQMARLWTPLAQPWFPDGLESTHLGLLKIVPHEARYWDGSHSWMARLFVKAAPVQAGIQPWLSGAVRRPLSA